MRKRSCARYIDTLHYRRISPHWHGADADAHTYCQGAAVPVAPTEFGTIAFLLCGDLFHEDAVRYAQEQQPDWLFFLFARAHSDDTRAISDWWIKDEMPHYQARMAQIGAATLATSYLAIDGCPEIAEAFGGAMAVRRDGTVHSTLALDKSGILYVNMTNMALRQPAPAHAR